MPFVPCNTTGMAQKLSKAESWMGQSTRTASASRKWCQIAYDDHPPSNMELSLILFVGGFRSELLMPHGCIRAIVV